mgnify:FL=1
MHRIYRYSDAIAIRGVGKTSANNIAEFVRSGRMPRLDAMLNERVAAVAQMKRIWGVGAKKATDLVRQGYRKLSDLRTLSLAQQHSLLSKASVIALRYVEDLYVPSLSVDLTAQQQQQQQQQRETNTQRGGGKNR